MGLLMLAGEHYRPAIEAVVGPKELAVVLVSLAGMAAYPLLLLASGGVTVSEVKALLRRRPKADLPPPVDNG